MDNYYFEASCHGCECLLSINENDRTDSGRYYCYTCAYAKVGA